MNVFKVRSLKFHILINIMIADQSSVLVTNITESVSILTIDSVTEGHEGIYTCVASQAIGDEKLNTVSITKVILLKSYQYH